jgi:hypothetical protein
VAIAVVVITFVQGDSVAVVLIVTPHSGTKSVSVEVTVVLGGDVDVTVIDGRISIEVVALVGTDLEDCVLITVEHDCFILVSVVSALISVVIKKRGSVKKVEGCIVVWCMRPRSDEHPETWVNVPIYPPGIPSGFRKSHWICDKVRMIESVEYMAER